VRLLSPVLLLVAAAPLAARLPADARERMTDTRQLATRWALAHVAPGSRVLVEHYGFDLLGHGWRMVFPIGEAGCVDADALLRGQVGYAAIERARAGRSNVDWGTMPAALRPGCRLDWAILAQMDRYRAERARFPAEWAAYRALAAQARVAAVIRPVPGRVGGPVVTVLDLRGATGS
jgi:hypothetical protein